MKKKNKKNQIRKRFSTLLLCCLAIVLCTTPALKAYLPVPAGETLDIDYQVVGVLLVNVNGTANLLTGASVTQAIYVQIGGTLNMYSGTIGWFINVSTGAAGITVYGTNFEDKLGSVDYGQWIPDGGKETLTGQYKDGSPINLLILSDTPINLQPPPRITIDIKPGSNDNSINLKSRGVVPVAVFTTDDFDASTINPDTVKFAGAGPPIRWKICDVDEDGDDDMLFHFKTKDLELDENDTKATLTGETFDGVGIEGTDTVRIVQTKK